MADDLKRKTFPILNGDGAWIDYQLVADHGEQAQRNHYQSVDRLAGRGGLDWVELFAVLNNQPFKKVDQNQAIAACRAIEARYLAALGFADRDRITTLQAQNRKLVEALRDAADGLEWAEIYLADDGMKSLQFGVGKQAARAAIAEATKGEG